jgi:biopolymer transport protein TolR
MHSLPSGKGRHRRAPMADINVTPMVDVMLVLLIIFMVTAPLLVAGVPVNLPDSRAKALEQQEPPLQISVDADGVVYIGDAPVAMEALSSRLAEIAANTKDGKPPLVHFRADRALTTGRTVEVLGEINAAGFNRIAIITTVGGGKSGQ